MNYSPYKYLDKKGVLLSLLIITLFPLFILSFYNHPWAEDFNAANLMLQKGFFESQKNLYLSWTGRYFTSIIAYFSPLDFDAYWAYKLNAVILLALLLIATYWLSGRLFKNLDQTAKIGITFLFIFSFIILMPDVGQGVFWLAGTYNCLSADIMTFFLFGCIIGYYHTPNKKSYFFFSCILAIAIIGCYEIHLVFIDLFILLFAFLNRIKKGKLIFPLILITVSIIFSVISIKAPGNNMRGLDYPLAHNLLYSLKETISYGKIYVIHWLPFMLFIGLLLFNLLFKRTIENDETDSTFIIPPWYSLLVCFTIPFIGVFLPIWAMGDFPPGRTVNGICFYFVVGMMYFSFSAITYIKKHYPDFSLSVFNRITMLILVLQLFSNDSSNNILNNNITRAYKDIISGKASAYNRERTERHEFLLSFKGDSCSIDSIKNFPDSFFFYELPADRNHWVNTSFCEYYHKKHIGIKGRLKTL